jgi:hypothetical protein
MASRLPRDAIPVEALLADFPPSHVAVAERLRSIVLGAVPSAIERVRPGWRLIGYDLPRRRGTTFFAWIWPEPEHVHLGFPLGILMSDPDRAMRGDGITKQARWLTYRSTEEVDGVVARRLVLEAIRVAGLSHEERRAIMADRELDAG